MDHYGSVLGYFYIPSPSFVEVLTGCLLVHVGRNRFIFPLRLCLLLHRDPAPSAVHAHAQPVCPIILASHKLAEGSSELQECVGGEL